MKKIIIILLAFIIPSCVQAATNPLWTGDVLPVMPSGQTQSPYGVGSTTSVSGFVRLYNHIAAVRGIFQQALTIGDVQGVSVNEIAGPPVSGFTENDTLTYYIYGKIDIGNSAIFSVVPYEFGEISITNTGYSIDMTVDPVVPNATSYRVCRVYNGGSIEYTDIPIGSANLIDRNNPGDPTWVSGCPVTPNSITINTYLNHNSGSGYWGIESNGAGYFASGLSVGSSTQNANYSGVFNGSGYFGNNVLSSYFTASSTRPSTFPYASTTALSWGTSSTTGNNGVSISAGCFSINNVCVGGSSISGGSVNTLAYWTGASTLAATGTPTVSAITATSTAATSTFKGGLVVGNNSVVFDPSTGTTTISNLYAGSISFDTNPGILTALDSDITSACTNGTVQSYSFNIDASTTPNLTIYGECNGAGLVKNQKVGVGTTTPDGNFSVRGPSGQTVALGTCFRAKDVGANTFTYWWFKAGVQTVQTTTCGGAGTTTITFD